MGYAILGEQVVRPYTWNSSESLPFWTSSRKRTRAAKGSGLASCGVLLDDAGVVDESTVGVDEAAEHGDIGDEENELGFSDGEAVHLEDWLGTVRIT